MRLFKNTNIDFMGMQRYFSFLSIILIFSGLASLFIKGGPALSIDFKGGTLIQIKFEKDINISELRDLLFNNGFDNNFYLINFSKYICQ